MEDDRLCILKAIAEAQIEAAGMTAENMRRQHLGLAIAYNDDHFREVIDKMNAVFEKYRH